jgi:membrane AbrB-like protein
MFERSAARFSRLPVPVHWASLLALSAFFATLLELLRLPAALLLGPMLAGIVVENLGARLRVPTVGVKLSQAVIGCLIAHAITGEIVHTFAQRWPLYVGITLSTLALSGVIGWVVARTRVVPGTTAIWGLLPGGASAMVLMAEEFGADARLVAFMQYLRVLFVTVVASLIARFWVQAPASPAAAPLWFPPLLALPLLQTAGLVVFGILVGRLSGIPNGVLLLPMAAGAWLQNEGLMVIDLPPWLLAASYLGLGWNVGLRFTREVLASARRALLPTVLSIGVLITACGGLAALLFEVLGGEPLAAYLATSPGGADSVAIIAASSHVDASFVMAFQLARLLAVMLLGPVMSRFVASRIAAAAAG